MPADSSTASGWSARTRAASSASRSNAGAGSSPARRDRHEPAQPQPGRSATSVGQRRHVGRGRRRRGRRARPPPPRSTWTQHLDRPARRPGRPGRGRATSDSPVDGVHDRAQPGHGGGLVALQLADEVPAQRQVGELGRLADQLLGPVLAEVALPQRGERPDVVGRPRLAHREQRDRRRVAAGRPRGGVDPRPDRAQVLRQVGHVAIFPGARAQPSQTRPAWRPVTPSRRWENRCGSSTVQRGSWTTSGMPALRRISATPARRSRPGVPVPGAHGGRRRHPGHVGLHRLGHLVAGAAHRGAQQRGHVPRPGPQARHGRQGGRDDALADPLAAGVHGGDHTGRRGRPAGPARSRPRARRGPARASRSPGRRWRAPGRPAARRRPRRRCRAPGSSRPAGPRARRARGPPGRGWRRRRPGRRRRGRRG